MDELNSPPDAVAPKPVSKALQTTHVRKGIRGRAVRGVGINLGTQGVMFGVQMASTAVLARLLEPHDFGLVGMVQVFTGMVAMFSDSGLSTATIQKEDLSDEQVSLLFWLNGALGIALMLIVAAASPLVALFYGEPVLVWVTLCIATTFPFAGFTVQHRALLKRQMRFKVLAVDRVLSLVLSNAIAIPLAWLGFGHWALVALAASQSVANMLLIWMSSGWRPGPPRRGADVKELIAFGGFLSGSQFLQYIRRNLDRMLIGAMWGAEALGVYRVAHRLILLPIQQINRPIGNVMVPALSRVQFEPEQYRSMYRDALFIVVSVGLPVVAAMLVTAPDLVEFVLGKKWLAAVPIFYALGPAAIAGALNVAGSWVFITSGRAGAQFRANVWLTIGIAGSMLVVAHWGPLAVAAAFSASFCLSRYPHFRYAIRDTPVQMRDIGAAILRPSLACIAGAVPALAAQYFLPEVMVIVRLVVACASFGVVYLALNGKQTYDVVMTNLRDGKTAKSKKKTEAVT